MRTIFIDPSQDDNENYSQQLSHSRTTPPYLGGAWAEAGWTRVVWGLLEMIAPNQNPSLVAEMKEVRDNSRMRVAKP